MSRGKKGREMKNGGFRLMAIKLGEGLREVYEKWLRSVGVAGSLVLIISQ